MIQIDYSAELQRIQKGYYDVINAACNNAYIRNNLPTPAQIFQQRGVVFLHNDLLESSIPKEMKQLGFDENNWIDFRNERNSTAFYMDAFTVGITRRGNWAYSPAITVFKPSSFNETHYSFNETFAHETLHRSGVGYYSACGLCSFLRIEKAHDLARYKSYEEIITNCGCSKEKIR